MKRGFFITGCQRSGTTLLRLVLESHPDIQCLDEALSYECLVKEAKGGECELCGEEGAGRLGFKIPRFTEQLLWGECSDPDYGVFPSFYQGEKVIHIVRDVLDVVSSMIRLKVADGDSWIDLYGRAILRALMENPNIQDKYKAKYKIINDKGHPAHLIGALYWEVKNQGYLDLLNRGKPVCAVKYESLVEAPKKELIRLCGFLDVVWDDVVLSHHSQPHSELDSNGLAIGNTDPQRSIDNQSVGIYVQTMTKQQIREVKSFVEELSATLESRLAQ